MYFPVTVPYKTSPVMTKNDREVYQPITNLEHVTSKQQELDRYGADLYACRRPDLVNRAAKLMGVAETDSIVELAMNFKEDIAIMHQGVLEAICFCYPSGWVPGERVGMSLAEIHGPVADGDMLRKMSQRIAETMATQDSMRRYVWTVSTTGELSNHPKMYRPPVDEHTTVDDLYFRMETQTTKSFGDGETSLFFVNVETCPLRNFWNDTGKKQTIIDSINSMSDAVLNYKHLIDIKKILTTK